MICYSQGRFHGGHTAEGPRSPVKFLPLPVSPPKKKIKIKIQDKAVACQNFQKACSAVVVILMLSRFVTF